MICNNAQVEYAMKWLLFPYILTGGEFTANIVKKYIKEKDVYQQFTLNEAKANYSEIMIKTLKNRIYKMMGYRQSHEYISKIDGIVQAYNNTPHSALNGRTPAQINDENEVEVWIEQYLPKPSKHLSAPKPKYKVGSLMRISFAKSAFSRGYHQQYSEEIFRIIKVNKTIPVTYNLQDLQKERLRGLFYEQELVYVGDNEEEITFKIEKILKRRTKNKQRQVLVRWLGYGSSFDSWEMEDSIKKYGDTI